MVPHFPEVKYLVFPLNTYNFFVQRWLHRLFSLFPHVAFHCNHLIFKLRVYIICVGNLTISTKTFTRWGVAPEKRNRFHDCKLLVDSVSSDLFSRQVLVVLFPLLLHSGGIHRNIRVFLLHILWRKKKNTSISGKLWYHVKYRFYNFVLMSKYTFCGYNMSVVCLVEGVIWFQSRMK